MKKIILLICIVFFSGFKAYSEEKEVEIMSGDCLLKGTMLVPDGIEKFPIALIISGSGPTDRNGNSPMMNGDNNSLKMLAEELLQQGIATIRYDKRGVAESSKECETPEEEMDFYRMKEDAIDWLYHARKDKRIGKAYVIGHSEGSLVGTVAAQEHKCDGFVSLCGMGRKLDSTLLEQLTRNKTPEFFLNECKRILDSLNKGVKVDDINPNLEVLFRKSVQPYLISLLKEDPAKLLSQLKMPVLIVSGSTDLQTTESDYNRLVEYAPNAQKVRIEGMNHVLKNVSGGTIQMQMYSYGDPTLPINNEVVEKIGKFILDNESK